MSEIFRYALFRYALTRFSPAASARLDGVAELPPPLHSAALSAGGSPLKRLQGTLFDPTNTHPKTHTLSRFSPASSARLDGVAELPPPLHSAHAHGRSSDRTGFEPPHIVKQRWEIVKRRWGIVKRRWASSARGWSRR